jgi:DNA-binding response OmpR family regulator
MKILLLDDEESILTSTKRMLERLGHEVTCAREATAAAGLVESGGFDLVLLDYMMPVHDGVWFMRNARIPQTTKVLLMTAFANRQLISEMFKLGIRGYLIKPVDAEELARNIEFYTLPKTSPP